MREYKRGRSSKNQNEEIKNFVGLSGNPIYAKDPKGRNGERRVSRNLTVYVRSIDCEKGIAIIKGEPYNVYLEEERWFLGDMVEPAEVAV